MPWIYVVNIPSSFKSNLTQFGDLDLDSGFILGFMDLATLAEKPADTGFYTGSASEIPHKGPVIGAVYKSWPFLTLSGKTICKTTNSSRNSFDGF